MKYSIVITTYNHVDDLLKPCIESIVRNTIIEDMEIIIVANGCTDHTREYVESLGDPFKLLWFDEPLGYTKAANEGFKIAQGEYIIPMNNDVEILDFWDKNQWLETLEAPFLTDEKVAVTGVSRLFMESTRRYFIIFFLSMVKREIFEKYGFYDEIFSPGWGEDSVTGDTPVIIKKNGLVDIVPIEDLFELNVDGRHKLDGVQVLTRNGWSNANYCYRHEVNKEIYRIRTSSSQINVTGDHSLFSNGVPISVSQLKIGDKIDLSNTNPLTMDGNDVKDSWERGLFMAEGSASIREYQRKNPRGKNHNIYTQVTCGVKIDMCDENHINTICENWGWKKYEFKIKTKSKYDKIFRASYVGKDRKEVTQLFINEFYTKTNKEKKIPISILNSNKESMKNFFDGYMIGDGHTEKRKNKSPRKTFTTKSQSVALGLQLIWKSFGIESSINTRKDKPNVFNVRELIGKDFVDSIGRTYKQDPEQDDGTILEISNVTKLYAQNGKCFVYDINTDDGTFIAGVGGVVAHNTDFCHKIENDGYKMVKVPNDTYEWTYSIPFPVVHKDGQTMKQNGSVWADSYDKTAIEHSEILRQRYFKPIKYSIIIPTYNHLEDLLKPCLESIRENTNLNEQGVEVIVVANGCTDDTASYIRSLGYPFRLLEFQEPLGYTKATNEGIKVAEGEYLILLNNDTKILPFPELEKGDWIKMLEHPFTQDDKMGLTGPMQAYCTHAEDDFIIFFCCMIPKRLFDELGLLDEIFSPGFGEDTDMAMRAKQAGYKIEQVPNYDVSFLDHEQKLMSGSFPIFHAGEETFKHMKNGDDLLRKNRDILAQRWGKGNKSTSSEIEDVKKLNLGCGDLIFDGYVNVDLYNERADLKADVRNLSMFSDKSVSEIVAYHVFEHISPYEVHAMLREWHRVLQDGGKLILELPDIEGMCKEFVTANKAKRYELLNCIYGTTQIEHPHLFGWYEEIMRDHLMDAGFVNVEKKDPQITGHWGVNMRIEAQKPQQILPISKNELAQENDRSLIYDGFLFSNELDILDIRLNELYDVVDKFIIVESPKTHTNIDKPLLFEENKERYAQFMDKIVHIVADDYPEWQGNPWDYERHQRHSISKGWTGLRDHDIVMVSDVDEIPNKEAVRNYKISDGFMTFQQTLSYYKINCVCTSQKWQWGKILPYGIAKTMEGPCHVRYSETPLIPNGGWHFSYIGDVKFIQKKLSEFSHWEYNTPDYNTEEVIRHRMEQGLDLFGRDLQFEFIDIDDSFPTFVRDNADSFIKKELIQTNRKIDRVAIENLDKATFYEIFLLNSYAIHPRDMKGKTVIDVGANRGIFSLYAYESGATRIISFEPNENNFKMLFENCFQYPEIEMHQVAIVGTSDSYVNLYGDDVVSSLYQNPEDLKEPQRARAAMLYEYLRDVDGNDLVLKMDCEGAEYDIMMNIPIGVVRRFKTIVMEIHDAIDPFKGKSSNLKELIVSLGYSVVSEYAFGTWYDLGNGERTFKPGLAVIVRFNRIEE